MKKCPNCGACQECGHVPPTWYQPANPLYPIYPQPWWGVIPPYQVTVSPPSFTVSTGTNTSGDFAA